MNTSPAESLAVAAAHDAAGSPLEVLSFELGGQTYGIDIRHVQEVRSYEAPTRLAFARPWLLGVSNLRGVIVPVVDLRARLGFEAGFDERTVTIVLNLRGQTTGIVVDSVCDVVALSAGQIKSAPATATPADAGHVQGLADLGAGLLILLDIALLLREMTGTGAPVVH